MAKTTPGANAVRLDLEDHGQDFTYFVVKDGVIVETGPFQAWVWNGREVQPAAARDHFRPGDAILFKTGKTLNYRVKSVRKCRWDAPQAAE